MSCKGCVTRKYSIHEIDEILERLENKYIYGYYDLRNFHREGGAFASRGYSPKEMRGYVEERARTLMIANIGPEDLVDDVGSK